MKKIILIIALLLSACSAINPEPTPTPKPTNTPALPPGGTPTVQWYLDTIIPIVEDIANAYANLGELFSEEKYRPLNAKWRSQVDDNLNSLINGADAIDNIKQIPPEAREAHHNLQRAVSEVRMAVLHTRKFLDSGESNEPIVPLVNEYTQSFRNYMYKTYDELEILYQSQD